MATALDFEKPILEIQEKIEELKKMSNDLKQNQNNDTLNQEFRPSYLGEVIGQDAVIEVLLNSILYNEIPNSIILQGQKGTGKTSTAKAFTKTLNCENLSNSLKPYLCLYISSHFNTWVDSILVEPQSLQYSKPGN